MIDFVPYSERGSTNELGGYVKRPKKYYLYCEGMIMGYDQSIPLVLSYQSTDRTKKQEHFRVESTLHNKINPRMLPFRCMQRAAADTLERTTLSLRNVRFIVDLGQPNLCQTFQLRRKNVTRRKVPPLSILFSHFHSSPSRLSDSFHGISIDDKVEDIKRDNFIELKKRETGATIQEAEVVKGNEEKRKTRELIAELVRAEILSYSTSKSDDSTGNEIDANTKKLSPYEKQMFELEHAVQIHSQILQKDSMEYSKSCKNVGEMQYRMGHMEQSQNMLLDGLQTLLENPQPGSSNHDFELLKSQIMHLLGAVMARCEEYIEAHTWYKEALTTKRKLLENSESSSEISRHHYELGKTLNGLAALEVMSGGETVNWEKAAQLFQDAEKSYIYDYEHLIADNNDHGWVQIPKEMVELMSPHLVQLVINVRSNMGELMRQQRKYLDALEFFQMSLDIAQMDVSRIHVNSFNAEAIETDESADPSPEERRNSIVDLLIKVADCHVAEENYDEAAASYEQALAAHVAFRGLSGHESNTFSENLSWNLSTHLPAATSKKVDIPLDLANATTLEAAVRNNLAFSLTRIGQEKLALSQYETSLQIKRHIGGNSNVEVGRTLMEMGALLAGPMKDLVTGLNCFKEALHIYKCQRDDIIQANSNRDDNSRQAFFDRELELDEINECVNNASKNIALVEDALLDKRR